MTLGQGTKGVFRWKADEVEHRPDGYSCIEMADDAKLDDVFEVSGPIEVKEDDGKVTMTAAAGRAFPSVVLKQCPLSEVRCFVMIHCDVRLCALLCYLSVFTVNMLGNAQFLRFLIFC